MWKDNRFDPMCPPRLRVDESRSRKSKSYSTSVENRWRLFSVGNAAEQGRQRVARGRGRFRLPFLAVWCVPQGGGGGAPQGQGAGGGSIYSKN